MNEESLNAALRLLDDFLTSGKAEPVWLVVGGGSALLVQQLSARQTKDVDVMALREWEGNVVSAYPLPDSVKLAAAKVAQELRLDPDWLNGAASLHSFDLVSLNPTGTELEELLRWIFKNVFETQPQPHLKLPTLLQELGHADLIHRFQ